MKIEIELTDDQAWAYAEYLKRIIPEYYHSLAKNKYESTAMMDAGDAIRTALAEAGYAPR